MGAVYTGNNYPVVTLIFRKTQSYRCIGIYLTQKPVNTIRRATDGSGSYHIELPSTGGYINLPQDLVLQEDKPLPIYTRNPVLWQTVKTKIKCFC